MDRVDGVYAQWSVFIYSWQSWILSQCLTPLIAEWHEALIISPVAADDLALPPATHSHEYGHSHAVRYYHAIISIQYYLNKDVRTHPHITRLAQSFPGSLCISSIKLTRVNQKFVCSKVNTAFFACMM